MQLRSVPTQVRKLALRFPAVGENRVSVSTGRNPTVIYQCRYGDPSKITHGGEESSTWESLEVYSHLALADAQDQYETVINQYPA
jgi:hypothetical protein